MAEIQAMNMVDATSAISAMLAPQKGQAELDETQPVEESEEETETAASEEDESGVEDAPDEETPEEQSEEEEEQEEQEQPQTFTVKVDGNFPFCHARRATKRLFQNSGLHSENAADCRSAKASRARDACSPSRA
jgi:hypothetical protein